MGFEEYPGTYEFPTGVKPRDILELWHENSRRVLEAHYSSAAHFGRLNLLLGLPTVIVATVVGATVLVTLNQRIATAWVVAIGLASVLAAVLSALQTFLQFADRAARHRASGVIYGSIKREIEEILATHAEVRPEDLSRIRGRMDGAASEAPSPPRKVWQDALRTFPARRVKRGT